MSNKEGSTANSADGELRLDAQETKFFTTMIKLLPKALNIDWLQLAAELDLEDGEAAKTLYNQIRGKHRTPSALGAASQSTTLKLATKDLSTPPRFTKPVNTIIKMNPTIGGLESRSASPSWGRRSTPATIKISSLILKTRRPKRRGRIMLV
ncbi:hypothetical protein F4679DRAFT_98431 [Xylaria curta]|nr:hypothetical protein F4679DRAFT_98431 [Xylaria curta]